MKLVTYSIYPNRETIKNNMANYARTDYYVQGTRKAVTQLRKAIYSLGPNTQNIPLSKLAEHFGIEWEIMGIHVRGHIYFADYDSTNDVLLFCTETAWDACIDLFDEINQVLCNDLQISYRTFEIGCNIYNVHDEGNFFPEECCVNCAGEPFDDGQEDVFDTVEDAIAYWCEKMGRKRGKRSTEKMMKYINKYDKYDNADAYYQINKFKNV